MDAVVYDAITSFQSANQAYTPGIRSQSLDVGATNSNLTISNNAMTPTNSPYAGYLLKTLTRLNLDRLTFPKIYKPANTKCQVDILGNEIQYFGLGATTIDSIVLTNVAVSGDILQGSPLAPPAWVGEYSASGTSVTSADTVWFSLPNIST